MPPVKVALCLECPLYQHGGVEVLVRELIRGLHREFDLYLVSDDEPEQLRLSPLGQMLKGSFHYHPEGEKRAEADRLMEWGRGQGIGIFHFHHGGTYSWNSRSWKSCVISRVAKSGIPCVATNHGAFGLMLFVGAQRPLWYKLAAFCLCWPAKLRQLSAVRWEATVSKHDYMAVRRWFFPHRSRFIQIYHSILDGTEEAITEKRQIILCLGTVGARKGQQFLAEAFGRIASRHSGWRLVIAGRHTTDGTSDAMFEAIRRHGVENQVDVLTDVPDSQAVELLRRAAIFAMPSLAEGLGLSLQEAMFHGAACVGTTAGGITDMIVHEKTGLLVTPGDPVSLADALERLMESPDLRQRLSAEGRLRIRSLGMTRQGMTEKHAALYREANG